MLGISTRLADEQYCIAVVITFLHAPVLSTSLVCVPQWTITLLYFFVYISKSKHSFFPIESLD